jgi:hypothetical protein
VRLSVPNVTSPGPYLKEEAQASTPGTVVHNVNQPWVCRINLYAQLLPRLTEKSSDKGLAAFKVASGQVKATVLESGVVPATQ